MRQPLARRVERCLCLDKHLMGYVQIALRFIQRIDQPVIGSSVLAVATIVASIAAISTVAPIMR